MTLNNAVYLMTQGVLPNQVIFKLNDDKTTYSVDCIYDSVKVNGEDTSMTIHSDKASFPADTDLLITAREDKNVWFDVIIPDEEKENISVEVRVIGTLHIETSNGKNCTTCNKSSVCKYKDSIEREVERIVEELEEKELPLSVNINCREWSSNNSSLTR